MILLLFYNCW